MTRTCKNLLPALTLLACLPASLAAAAAPPATQYSAPLSGVELARLPLGDFGYLEYDPSFPTPDAERYGQLIRLLFSAFPGVEMPDRLVLRQLRFVDFEAVAVKIFGQNFLRDVVQDFECLILIGFNTPGSLSDELAEVYVWQLGDEIVIHEFLHHILHRISPVPIKRYRPGDWPQNLMNDHEILIQITRKFMGSPLYKGWLRRTR